VGVGITGNTIFGNYQAGNAIAISGSTISGNYQPGVGIGITGNTIFGNYQQGVGVNINGNVISGNYKPGTGININGNVISSTASSNGFWNLIYTECILQLHGLVLAKTRMSIIHCMCASRIMAMAVAWQCLKALTCGMLRLRLRVTRQTGNFLLS